MGETRCRRWGVRGVLVTAAALLAGIASADGPDPAPAQTPRAEGEDTRPGEAAVGAGLVVDGVGALAGPTFHPDVDGLTLLRLSLRSGLRLPLEHRVVRIEATAILDLSTGTYELLGSRARFGIHELLAAVQVTLRPGLPFEPHVLMGLGAVHVRSRVNVTFMGPERHAASGFAFRFALGASMPVSDEVHLVFEPLTLHVYGIEEQGSRLISLLAGASYRF